MLLQLELRFSLLWVIHYLTQQKSYRRYLSKLYPHWVRFWSKLSRMLIMFYESVICWWTSAYHMNFKVGNSIPSTNYDYISLSMKNGGKPPVSYQSFLKLAGQPSWASSPLSMSLPSLPPIGEVGSCGISEVPTLEELGYREYGQVWGFKYFKMGPFKKPFTI